MRTRSPITKGNQTWGGYRHAASRAVRPGGVDQTLQASGLRRFF